MSHELQNLKLKNHIMVVMPCYNHAQYVERAVLSVVCQTYKDFDLVVIDDGSKDDSVQKLKELQKQYGILHKVAGVVIVADRPKDLCNSKKSFSSVSHPPTNI